MAGLEKKKSDLLAAVPKCLVSTAGNPRTVRILPRGNWLDESGPVVEPAIPHFLGQLDTPGRRANRLDLARWIVSRDNPLTARVFVNRQWKLFFGQGISKVLDDLGSQGEWPTHPELIDWLASEFMDSGWDMKHTIRLLVTSGAYRQTSLASPESKETDPYNRLYAHQSRFRIDAEMVRDNALAVSGLLVGPRRRAERLPLSAGRLLVRLEFPGPRVEERHRRQPLPPRAIHALAALVPAPQPRWHSMRPPAKKRSASELAPISRSRRWCC